MSLKTPKKIYNKSHLKKVNDSTPNLSNLNSVQIRLRTGILRRRVVARPRLCQKCGYTRIADD
jgi:predicted Zn-ribbon and HTH transcriptional regulator